MILKFKHDNSRRLLKRPVMSEGKSERENLHSIDFTDPDLWDDTELIAMYDAEMERYKAVVSEIDDNPETAASEGNEQNRESSSADEAEAADQNAANHLRCHFVLRGRKRYNFRKRKGRAHYKGVWKVGDICMAKFCRDGTYRKGRIYRILHRGAKLLVIFDGYEDEIGPVPVRWNHVSASDCAESNICDEKQSGIQMAANGNPPNSSLSNEFGGQPSTSLIRPPVAIPPPYLPKMDNALNSMLIAWYMAGYHAGFYQWKKGI
uniref:Survival motor neuron Tudor domain-containing protein n=1 Tax=Trichuris muris TaxID=70415 RepID=A0A5S6QDF7_TRIMR